MKNIRAMLQLCSAAVFAALCIFTPPVISYLLVGLLLIRVLWFLHPTKGAKTGQAPTAKKALLVIDVQQDMCGETGIYPQKEAFLQTVKRLVAQAKQQNQTVIFIRQQFSYWDVAFCFLAMGGCLLQGTKGAALCPDLASPEDFVAEKHQQDAFSNKKLDEYLHTHQIDTLSIIGLDASACVYKTALGAANRGYSVSVVREGVLAKKQSATDRALQKLLAQGITIL